MITKFKKRTYITPQIERVKLDNEISLILVSGTEDPGDPQSSIAPEYFNNPFKTNLS